MKDINDMNRESIKIFAETLLLLAMEDMEYTDSEENFIEKYLTQLWIPEYGNLDILMEEIAYHIENKSYEGEKWTDQIKENAHILSKKLSPQEKDLLLRIVKQLYLTAHPGTESTWKTYAVFKKNFL
jgi:hypothetical protein